MAQEIGTAYVTVQPSAKGFGKAVEGQTAEGLAGAQKKADKGFLGMAKKAGKWGAAAVLAAGAAITGLAIKGGISRALNIEDAQAKLKGLGHDAKAVDQIMVDALASVKGTAYGLDSAATTAASAVAAGIEPGKELEGYLRLTADAATIAGVSMEEMGDIINKVTAKGKVSAREINQFTERGIPILQMLADEYGVTAEEMSKMVSRGEVDAERFRKALEDNIGGAALESGNTTRGAFANMGAALSRLGLTVVRPFVDNAKTVFSELTTVIDGLNDRIGPLAEKFSEWFGTKISPELEGFGERFLDWFDRIGEFVEPLKDILTLFSPLGIALKALGPALSGSAGDFENLGQAVADVVIGAGDTLVNLVTEVLPRVVDAIVAAAPQILDAAVNVFTGLVDGATQALPKVIDAVVELIPKIIEAITGFVPKLAEAAVTLFTGLVEGLTTAIPQVVQAIADAFPQIVQAGIDLFLGLVDGLLTALPDLLRAVIEAVPAIVESLISMLPVLVDGARELFMGLIIGLLEAAPLIIAALIELVPMLVLTLIDMIPMLIDAGIQLFTGLVDSIPIILPQLTEAIVNMLPSILEAVLDMLPSLIEAGVETFTGLVTSVTEINPTLLQTIADMLPGLVTTVTDMMPDILAAGIELFTEITRAVTEVLPDIVQALVDMAPDLVAAVIDSVPALLDAGIELFRALVEAVPEVAPEIAGAIMDMAPELAGAVLSMVPSMFSAGADLMRGLADGIGSAIGSTVSAAKEAAGSVVGSVKGFFGISSPSRVFRDEIGKQLIAGLALGLGDPSSVIDATKALGAEIMDAFAGTSLDAGVLFSGAGIGGSGVGSSGAQFIAQVTAETGAGPEEIANAVLYGMRRMNRGGVYASR